MKIRVTSQEQTAATLSGGNQQKVVLAKWLAKNADIIIFDEPTRGIDVGAKYEIYLLMNRLVARRQGGDHDQQRVAGSAGHERSDHRHA